MAIAFIQGTGQNVPSGTTNAKAYASALTAGSYLLAFVLANNGVAGTAPTVTIADTALNIWSQKLFSGQGTFLSNMYIFGAPNTAGAVANTVTVTYSGAVTLGVLGILEYTGVFNSSPIDVIGAFLDSTGTSYTGTAVTTTRLNDVVLGFGYSAAGASAVTPGVNQTTRFNGTTNSGVLALDQPAATLGTYTPTCTIATSQELALATIALASVAGVTVYSEPDCRAVTATTPNLSRNVQATLTYDVQKAESRVPGIIPVDSRAASIIPVDSRITLDKPQNSRTPGTFGPGQ